MEERIMTLHPQGKEGVNILRRRYDTIKSFILEAIKSKGGQISYTDLNELATQALTETFDGKVLWYIVTVKLDLEARQIIKRIPRTSPHELRLVT